MSAEVERGTEAPRARRPVLALLAANAVSQVGNMMSAVAVPWFVLETTGSAALTGLTSATIAIGAVLSAVLGGPLVDRLGFRRASVLGDLVSGTTVALIPVLHLAGVLTFWQLLLLVFVFSSVNAQGDTARFALIPALSSGAGLALERTNAADRAVARGAQIVGPLVAGVLILVIGASNVLFVQAATFALSATLVALGVPAATRAASPAEGDGRGGYLSQLLDGLNFLRGNRLILSMALMATVGNLLDVPLLTVILPVYARQLFASPTSMGAVLAALAAGALVGTLLYGAVGPRLPRRVTFLASFTLAPALLYGALAATLPLPLLVVLGAAAGIIAGPINPLLVTVVQEATPPQLSGRVFGALSALVQVGVPLGAAVAGFVVEGVGVVTTIAVMGLIYVTMSLTMLFNPALRPLDRTTS